MIWLTGSTGRHTRARGALHLGIMLQPGNAYVTQVADYDCHAADNGCFAQGGVFDLDAYLTWLATVPRLRCLFATAPDVYGDAAATLRRSLPVLPVLRSLGFRAALVAQNGLTVQATPWDRLDALFLGGPGLWKLGPEAQALVTEARRRGKWVHMGRANGRDRIQTAQLMGCHSADGTRLARGPDRNWPAVRRWLGTLQHQEPLFLLSEVVREFSVAPGGRAQPESCGLVPGGAPTTEGTAWP